MDILRILFIALFYTTNAYGIAESGYLTMERSRLTAANQIQLYAVDMIDDLIYEWITNPPFNEATNLSLVSLDVPMGLNPRMKGILENHFYSLMAEHGETGIAISHCRSCTQLTAYNSGSQTIYGQGYDVLPRNKLTLPQNAKLLFLDFSVDDHYMILRVKVVDDTPRKQVLYAKTIVKSSSEAPLLREDKNIVSKKQAREQYLKMLKKDYVYAVPLTLDVYSFEAADDAQVGIIPMVWWDISVEGGASMDRTWLFSAGAAFAYLPDSYAAFRMSGRLLYRLDSGYYSMARPRTYLFSDLAFSRLTGPGVAVVADDSKLTPVNIIANEENKENDLETILVGIKFGVQLRINRLYRFSAYIQTLPSENGNDNLTSDLIKSYGAEIGVAL